MEKIPFQNRIIALLLSLVLVVGLFVSLFALPAELVFFNPQRYMAVLQQPEYSQALPGILSEVLVDQTIKSEVPSVVNLTQNKDTLVSVIADNLSAETVGNTFNNAINQAFSYLNFKIPTSDMKIGITDIKNELAGNSAAIAAAFLGALPNCSESQMTGFDSTVVTSAADLPACKPGSSNLTFFNQTWTKTFEDTFNSLPSSVTMTNLLPLEQTLTDRNFYYYSLIRWGFRLVPIVSILLLILVAVLLRKRHKVMWKWIGWLLTLVSGLTLIGLVVLLIGFDQFIAMTLNPYLKNLVTGFGFVLLGAIQDVGYQMLLWVIISTAVMLVFGLMLLIAGRFAKELQPVSEEQAYEAVASDEMPAEIEPQKAVIPETMEETEEKEKEMQDEEKNKEEEA